MYLQAHSEKGVKQAKIIINFLDTVGEKDIKINLEALALITCFMIDNIKNPDQKLIIYEHYIKMLSSIMATAPGVK